jgi:hypothetical protein
MTGPASNQPDTFSAALRAGRIRVSSAAMASTVVGRGVRPASRPLESRMEAKPALLLPAHLGVSSLNWGAPSLVRPVFSGGDAQANGSGRHPPPAGLMPAPLPMAP